MHELGVAKFRRISDTNECDYLALDNRVTAISLESVALLVAIFDAAKYSIVVNWNATI